MGQHEVLWKVDRGPSIVVGLDFGTTFSGVAWALEGSTSNDDVEALQTWPGGNNRTSVKVPSLISYEDEKIRWGYQVGPDSETFRGIKLLLDEDQETRYTPSLASKPLLFKYRKNAVQVAGDYLRQLVDQVKQVLHRRFGAASAFMDLKFVLTAPAVWSDKAKDGTLRAAMQAHIPANEVSLVSEPEAAALYTLRSIQPNSIAEGDVFIVCDAGGGTVDLISYRIKKLEPLCLAEVTEGTGGVCGSMILDQRFEEHLAERMGRRYAILPQKAKEAALLYWQDRVKPNFTGRFDNDFADVDYFVPIPGAKDDPTIPIEDGFFQLDSDDIEQIFDPIVREVEALISQQAANIGNLEHSIKAIVLVGGFGSSEYLFSHLQEAYPEVEILQPPDAWSAVVRGAVHRGLDGNQIESRIARRHYGVQHSAKYEPWIHGSEAKAWDVLEEKYIVKGRMKWHIRKSSELREEEPIRFPYYRTVAVEDIDGLVFSTRLEFCNDEHAPDVWNPRVMKLCTLEADLNEIPQELFDRRRNSKGQEYYRISFDLVLTPASASLLFELEFRGVSYGIVRSKY